MAIISFYSNEKKETGQTLSLAAIATHMSIEHNFRILIVSTNFNDVTLENCFWEYGKLRGNKNGNNVGIDAGIEGLVKVLNSNRINDEIVKNYTKTIIRDRLDMLMSPKTPNYSEYQAIASNYGTIISMAKKYYDLIFIDISKKLPQKDTDSILQMSDLIILNASQRLKTINDLVDLRENNAFFKRKNVSFLIGRYDSYSKYNNKNIARYLKEKREISVVPYNTLFFEACSEGTIVDYILKMRSLADEADRNNNFVKELKEDSKRIIYRLQELQMKI